MTDAIAAWVPPSVLAAAVVPAFYFMFTRVVALIDKLVARVEALEKGSHAYATTEQLGRLGDRMDGRVTNVTERVAVLEALGRRTKA